MKENKEVPIGAAVKWLIKERDEYKRKLDILVPYTKKLEKRVKELEEYIDKLGDQPLNRIKSLEGENRKLKEEKSNLLHDYQKSDWYRNLQMQTKKDKERIKRLKEGLDVAIKKLGEYETVQGTNQNI